MTGYSFVVKPVIVTFLVACLSSSALQQEVDTSSGRIRGIKTYHNGQALRTYLAVPYATPPIGDLRFKRPLPVRRSTRPIHADKMPPACIQYTEVPLPWTDDGPGQSEDCLYLNIWAPVAAGPYNRKAVMFWIFGGEFKAGSNRLSVYDGRALAVEGDVIVVTINYRLGVLGFLTTGSVEAPGNQALYDTLEALRWTTANIGAFGGDTDRITISGEGSGAEAASLLCASPLAKGLFQRAILQSGRLAYAKDFQSNAALSRAFTAAVGCRDVECLRGKDAMHLARTMSSFTVSFEPMFGDSILPMDPRQAVMDRNVNRVDLLIGCVRDAGAFQLTTTNPEVFGFFGEKDPKINLTLGKQLLRKMLHSFDERETAVDYYLRDLPEDDYYAVRRQVYMSYADYAVLCPTVYFAERYALLGSSVYFYYFQHSPGTSPWAPWMGTVQFKDVQFVFGSPLKSPANYTKPEKLLSWDMVNLWSSFAKDGYPHSVLLPSWPKYSRGYPMYPLLDTRSNMKYTTFGPHSRNCNFYRPYLRWQ